MSREPHDFEGKRSGASQAGEVLGVGMQFAGSILLFLFAGRWLDGRLGTEPWLMIVGVMIGAAAGFFSMYRQLVIAPQRRQQKREER
jgi:F0F1-type ATP synthase assembly protein I